MRFTIFKEMVREETVVKLFSRLVTLVSDLYEIVADDRMKGDELRSAFGHINVQIGAMVSRLERLNVPKDLWDGMASGVTAKDVDSWGEMQSLLTRRILPELSASIELILKMSPGREAENAMKVLKERVIAAQEMLTGLAPVGQAAADNVSQDPVV